MSASTSPVTGKLYGVELVCCIGGFPRSSYYAKQGLSESAATTPEPNPKKQKRGPKTILSDNELLDLIRADLKASPWIGEGHRKVHARLRMSQTLPVGRKRVLRIMRENNLLSPSRCRIANDGAHDGTIITQAPGELWATDGTQVMTVDDGNVWIFTAIEHWNAECVGWHVAKIGNRFAALQPISMAIQKLYGATGPSVARGLSLRMDHGSQYTADDFQRQIKHWGITPSFGFIGQPDPRRKGPIVGRAGISGPRVTAFWPLFRPSRGELTAKRALHSESSLDKRLYLSRRVRYMGGDRSCSLVAGFEGNWQF